jgi:hypothetical protein
VIAASSAELHGWILIGVVAAVLVSALILFERTFTKTLRAEFASLREDIRMDLGSLRTELGPEFGSVRSEVELFRTEMVAMREVMDEDFAAIHRYLDNLESNLAALKRHFLDAGPA